MRIGLAVDGTGEADALPWLLSRIDTPHEILQTIAKGNIQPNADPTQIAVAAAEACQTFARRRLDLVVLIVDLEDRPECPGAFADMLRDPFARFVARAGLNVSVEVVVKAAKLENWLVADLSCLNATPRLSQSCDG